MLNLSAKNLLVYIVFFFYLTGCGAPESQVTPTPKGTGVTLYSNFSTVNYNGSITVDWSTSEVDTCTASGDWSGSKSTTGSEIISSLTADSTFVLTCTGINGDVSDTVNVSVGAPPLPTVTLSATPNSAVIDGSTTLDWSSTTATSCTASGNWSGNRNTSGSTTRNNLTADETYILTCSGPGGTASDSVTVTVVTPSAPIVNLSASPLSVAYDGSTILSWSSSNVDTCTASGNWSGSKSTTGSEIISSLITDSTFVLTCTGINGDASGTVNITVAAPVLPTVSLSANPSSVVINGSTTLNWSSTDATGCTASGDWSGSKATSGSEMINALTTDSSFNLTCSGASGSANDTINVTVVLNSIGTALLSWTPPTENTDSSPLTDLAGYKIYYGTTPGNYGIPITINNPGLSSYLVENLASSNWYFVMVAFNSSGIESSYSPEVSKTIN